MFFIRKNIWGGIVPTTLWTSRHCCSVLLLVLLPLMFKQFSAHRKMDLAWKQLTTKVDIQIQNQHFVLLFHPAVRIFDGLCNTYLLKLLPLF